MLGIIGIIIAVAVLIVGAYKGIAAIPLTIFATIIVAALGGLNIWDSLVTNYSAGFAGVIQSYLLMFVASSCYASLLEMTGAGSAIAYKLMDWFGRKNVIIVMSLTFSLLVYGGISIFVVLFCLGPLTKILFKEANLPRHLMMIPVAIGTSGWTYYYMPGTTQLANVIPTQFLGTTLTAAPVLSILISVAFLVAAYFYIKYAEKKAVLSGEGWTYVDGENPERFELPDRSILPSAVCSFLPLIIVIAMILLPSLMNMEIAQNSTLLVVISMVTAFIVCAVLNWKHIPGRIDGIKDALKQGATNAISGMLGLAAVIGFGTVVASSPAFADIVSWVIAIDISPYWKATTSTALIAAVSGSGSSGIRLTLQYLGDYFVNSGADLDVIHRLTTLGASTIETLPHNGGLFLVMGYMGLTHANSYKHMWWLTVVLTTILAVVATLIISLIM